MSEDHRLRVALLGQGEQAAAWRAALLRGADLCPLPEGSDGDVDAVVVGPGSENPFARAHEALLAGRSVLYAASFMLTPWQASLLEELSRRQKRLLRFVEPFRQRTGFSFLQRLLEGREPFWKPLYFRALALDRPHSHVRLDDLATEELALCDSLNAGQPASVSAAAAHVDEAGEVCASLMTVQFQDGPPLQCTVSLVEATPVRRLVAVSADRTVVMDQLDPVAPLRIIGADSESDEMSPLNRDRRGVASVPDEETRQFLHAVATADLSYGNSGRWARVAAMWSAARQSMSFGGSVRVPVVRPVALAPPALRVIEGGGSTLAAARRPALTIVG